VNFNILLLFTLRNVLLFQTFSSISMRGKDVKSGIKKETPFLFSNSSLLLYVRLCEYVWQGGRRLILKGSKVFTWRSLGTYPASTAARVAPTKKGE